MPFHTLKRYQSAHKITYYKLTLLLSYMNNLYQALAVCLHETDGPKILVLYDITDRSVEVHPIVQEVFKNT